MDFARHGECGEREDLDDAVLESELVRHFGGVAKVE